jgi:hypothetical protein
LRRGGFIHPELLKTLGASIVVAGATYEYDQYVEKGWEIGYKLLDKIRLGTDIRYMGELGYLPGPVFDIIGRDGTLIHVVIQQDETYPNKWYVTASYEKHHWWPFWGSFKESVPLVTKEDNYTIYFSTPQPQWTRPRPPCD